jgi:hypothetical protein
VNNIGPTPAELRTMKLNLHSFKLKSTVVSIR